MDRTLLTHFVDASGVELEIDFEERRVEMSAFDEATRQRYALVFAQCLTIRATFMEGDGDRYNLTDGVAELSASDQHGRRFRIGFVDESVLDIECRDFTMTAVSGGRYPDTRSSLVEGEQL